MKRTLRSIGLAVVAAALAACGMAGRSVDEGTAGGDGASPGVSDSGSPSGGGGGVVTTGGGGQAGILTAGDWDDNLNFNLFLGFLDQSTQGTQGLAELPVRDRVTLSVRDANGAPVSGAKVTLSRFLSSLELRTGTDGKTLFLPSADGFTGSDYTVTVDAPSGAHWSGTKPEGSDWTFTLEGAQGTGTAALDLAFVVDTTGSMGDELSYLKAEVQGIADGVRAAVGDGVDIRYGLVVYRDTGDDYVTRSFDFTADLASFRASLSAQDAGGGGDWPESMEQGARAMNGLSWRSGNVARVAFLIADAPPHADRAGELLTEVNRARRAGIRLYTVAASGTAGEGEYYLRAAAQMTAARYLFLTDDSGVGEPHDEPHIPCYRVQKLNGLMVRMVQSEVSGVRVDAAPADILRSVGNPQNGTCTLADGTVAYY